ncbi:MAG: prepilin-type N-terminal cleavage/methylation domain-containing protein [Gemmatimonadota bacterium]|jgi:prepilin-type N-terminal cleavage/methylation domain-containing protein
MSRGATLLELTMVLAIVSVLATVVTPPLGRYLDSAAVQEAVQRYAVLHETTRQLAIARGALARLELDSARKTVTLAVRRSPSAWDTVDTRTLGSAALSTSQPVITFDPIGIGYGTSNSRIVFSRGATADTLFVSRTGRLRRS